ncbi:MAG: hypothetical protein L6R40_001468 [Gallowayella cf. fulva]|nr:MAG: hypothetical protein L6R40_001468 [Xanthomendoza cf. fulva]
MTEVEEGKEVQSLPRTALPRINAKISMGSRYPQSNLPKKNLQTISVAHDRVADCKVAEIPHPKTTNAAQTFGGTIFHISAWNSNTMYEI